MRTVFEFIRRHKSLVVALGFALLTIAVFVVFEEPMTAVCKRVLQGSREHATWVLAVAFALLVSDIVLPIPSSVVIALAGAAAGVVPAAVVAALGLTVSAAVGYHMGARMPEPAKNPQGRFWILGFDVWVAFTRSIPVLAESVAVYAGSARKPFGRFLVASLVGCAAYAGLVAWGAAKVAG